MSQRYPLRLSKLSYYYRHGHVRKQHQIFTLTKDAVTQPLRCHHHSSKTIFSSRHCFSNYWDNSLYDAVPINMSKTHLHITLSMCSAQKRLRQRDDDLSEHCAAVMNSLGPNCLNNNIIIKQTSIHARSVKQIELQNPICPCK